MKNLLKIFIILSILSWSCTPSWGQVKVNYDEGKIGAYELPDPLVLKNGDEVKNIHDWEELRRPEILAMFENEVYGEIPGELNFSSFEIIEKSDSALNNTAIRKQIRLNFVKRDLELTVDILLYLPKQTIKPPVFIGYNFYGNHTITNDTNIFITKSWVGNNASMGTKNNLATEKSRGKRVHRWAIKEIINAGFGIATVYYGDVDPDKNDFSDGVHPFFYAVDQSHPKENEWGSIAAWAWGLSRVIDYFEEDEDLDSSKVILMGHSRLGKTSLWAGALDERFDIVISNDSGCGGAAIFRRKYGETAEIINTSFPHWFSINFKAYSNNEDALPIDQHMLISLMAPRPVYIASAENDQWADPKGEVLAGYHAGPVYELYGKKGLPTPDLPEVNQPIHNTIGYHIRTGDHDVTDYDWEQYIKFALKHLN